jgi:thioesterase domain-containing protein/acyl carrier protein
MAEKLPEFMMPSKFVVLERLPMTTSGKVDRRALPVPAPDPRESARGIAPRNEVESKLVALFQNVLGIPSVGITDNFFDLGGHSLLAARLVSEVGKIAGQHIPLSALFGGATVESLAQLIQKKPEANEDRVAIEIQRGSGGLLFFAIVPPGEESLGYAILARHMGPEHGVYKIQGQAPIVGKRPYTEQEMNSMADEYATAVRTVQPHGPYCLGGLCDGTHIAERVVLKLEEQGEEVALFAIFDTWVLQHSQRLWLWRLYYFGQRLHELRGQGFAGQLRAYSRAGANLLRRLVQNNSPGTDWQQTYWPPDFAAPHFRAPIILFKRPKQPFYYINDPQMGWGKRTDGRVEICEVDFHHGEILREPHVRLLGEKLAACIEHVSSSRKVRDPAFADS